MPRKTLDANIVDGIPGKFYGLLRDVIEIEITHIDNEPYTTNMRSSDAIRDIYMGALKLDKNQIIGVQISWKGKPNISFRLKEKLNIDSLPRTFSYEKKRVLEDGKIISSTIGCVIKGVKPKKPLDDGTRTIVFEKCGWKITHEQIEQWSSIYGTVLSKVTESTDNDLDPDVQPEGNTVGCGNLQITVKLKKPMPQFLPMHGYKVRIYYQGISRVCTNCYKTGHIRKECPNPNKPWLNFVVDFITDNEQIPEEYFGFWMKKSREYIQKNPEMFDCPDVDLDDLNIDTSDDDSQSNFSNETFTAPNSPKIIETEPIKSVSNAIETLET